MIIFFSTIFVFVLGIRGNGEGGCGSGSVGRRYGNKNGGIWGGLILEGNGSVDSAVCGVVVHIADFVF